MAQSVKVPEDQFKAALQALLNTPAKPATKITKRKKKS
jgi:hypothetical protein